ncbi:MAG TPA: hypothetical protein VHZ54_10850 [Solirubrobacterales bacterium]|jgi:hypothetical protein|nr:hypothetical protein [Solirubrobacterales bacterium]
MGAWARRGLSIIVLAIAVTSAVPASGAELTRHEYVARAEGICKVGVAKAGPLITAGFHQVQANKVGSAAPKFTEAAKVYEGVRRRLLGIPTPGADAKNLTAWLKRLEIQNEFLALSGKALDEGLRVKAQGFFTRFIHNGNLANDLVLGYGFKSCLFHQQVK